MKPRMGRKNLQRLVFCRPCRGLDGFVDLTHGFTVGYYLSRLRRWNCVSRGATPEISQLRSGWGGE